MAIKNMIILFTLLFATIIIFTLWYAREYFTWHPDAALIKKFSKSVNLPRLPGEKLSVWRERVYQAQDELLDASDDFMKIAMQEGTITKVGEQCYELSLPSDHPAAIRYAKAKGLTQ